MELEERDCSNHKRIFVSLIIPIYNVALYLPKCLDSVLAQTYENYEVILVNDGSNDDSEKIAKGYCENNPKFQLHTQANQGLSVARNKGISLAQGDYVCFLDSDDYYEPEYLEKLVAEAERSGSDMVICDYYEVTSQGERKKQEDVCPYPNGIVDKKRLFEVLTKVGTNHFATAVVVAWNKLIKTEIMKNNLYPVGKLHEDEFVIFDLINSCNQISWISDSLYAYVTRNDGIMHTLSDETMQRHLCVLDAYAERIEKSYEVVPELTKSFWWAYYQNAILYLHWFCGESKTGKMIIKKTIRQHYWCTWRRYSRLLSFKDIVVYFLRGVKNIEFY